MWPFSWFKELREQNRSKNVTTAVSDSKSPCDICKSDCCAALPKTVTRTPMPPVKEPRRSTRVIRSGGPIMDGGDDGIDLVDVYVASEIASSVVQAAAPLIEAAADAVLEVTDSIGDSISDAVGGLFDD